MYSDHVTPDVSLKVFKARRDEHGFVVMDKDGEIGNGRYRIGYGRFAKDI